MLKKFIQKTPYHGEFFEQAFLEVSGKKVRYGEIARDENGKPQAVLGWHFSMTHSGPFCAVVFSRDGEVGTDLERRETEAKIADSKRILRKILSPGEKLINGSFLNNFVIKEAVSKLTGEGLSMGFSKCDANELIKQYCVEDYSTDEYVWWVVMEKA